MKRQPSSLRERLADGRSCRRRRRPSRRRSRRLLDRVSPEAGAHHGEQPARVVRAALARKAAHQRERDHRRGHAELDRFERGPAPFARVGDHRRDAARAPRRRCKDFGAADRAATSAPRCRGARSRRAVRRRCRARCAPRAARSLRRAPASSRTRCRCGSSWRSGRRRSARSAASRARDRGASRLRERLEDLDRFRRAAEHQAVAVLAARARRPRRRHRCSAPPAATAPSRGAWSRGSSCCRRRPACRRWRSAARGSRIVSSTASPAGSESTITRSPSMRAHSAARSSTHSTPGLGGHRGARRLGLVVAQHLDAAAREPPRHAGAHPAQADDSDLHAAS